MDCVIRKWRLKDAEEYIESMLSADQEKTFAFAITLGNKVIGSIGVFRCENIHSQTAELGYYIGEPYWGKGFMTSAACSKRLVFISKGHYEVMQ